MNLVKDRSFFAALAGHFAVDLLNGQRSLLLAFLSVPLGLSNLLIGAISTTYMLLGSSLQPFFGWLADRFGARWLAALGILWTAGAFSMAALIDGRMALFPLIATAIGSAAFHPAGTMEATTRGHLHFAGRAAFAASLFFLFGLVGQTAGPAVGGMLLDRVGPAGLTLFLILAVPIGVNAGLQLPSRKPGEQRGRTPLGRPALASELIILAMLIAFRSWSQMSLLAFLPKYYSDLGYRAAVYGVLAALYTGGAAVAGVLGGWFGDRMDKRRLLTWTLLLAGVPLALMPVFGPTDWAYLIVPLAGGLIGASHSPIVVLAQGMLPRNVGAASGMVLGFTFASGSIGALFSGLLADRMGFAVVFQVSAALVVLAGVLARATRLSPVPAAGDFVVPSISH